MVSADDIGRSLRGASGLVSGRAEALAQFDLSPAGFARSFAAISLTLPAYIVSLALHRRAAGLDVARGALFDDAWLALLVAAGHVACFLALPLAMLFILGGGAIASRFVPWAIVTNWTAALGSYAVALPGALFLMGLETTALTMLFTAAFALIVLQAQWFATRITLGVERGTALAIVGLGLLLELGLSGLVWELAV